MFGNLASVVFGTLKFNFDVKYITTLLKGTHWIWEIVSMVTSEAADYDTRSKRELMLEFQ